MKNRPAPINLVGLAVHLDGRHGTIRRWAAQPGGLQIDIEWADGEHSWHSWHSVHGPT